ncbi:MAG: archease [Desulfomonilaceae bacterium]
MELNDKGWTILDHPADVMVEIHGKTFEEFCQNAVKALNHFLGRLRSDKKESIEKIEIEGSCPEELVVNLLRELVYRFYTSCCLVTKIRMRSLKNNKIEVETVFRLATVGSDSTEIKGITYHGLSVQENGSGYHAKMVFDV